MNVYNIINKNMKWGFCDVCVILHQVNRPVDFEIQALVFKQD